MSSNNYSVHNNISVSWENGMITESKLCSKVKPMYHNEDNRGKFDLCSLVQGR